VCRGSAHRCSTAGHRVSKTSTGVRPRTPGRGRVRCLAMQENPLPLRPFENPARGVRPRIRVVSGRAKGQRPRREGVEDYITGAGSSRVLLATGLQRPAGRAILVDFVPRLPPSGPPCRPSCRVRCLSGFSSTFHTPTPGRPHSPRCRRGAPRSGRRRMCPRRLAAPVLVRHDAGVRLGDHQGPVDAAARACNLRA
jgi:hypothetical protein